MTIERWKKGRHWAIYDEAGELLCICVYLKGAGEIVRLLERLTGLTA